MTKKFINKINVINIIYVISLLACISCLIILPKLSISAFFDGVTIWATKVLPALLPFFILTKLLSYTNFISHLGKFLSPVTQKLYGVGGVSGYIFAMSIISGYPIGAKLTMDFYQNRVISEKQASTITSFCSTSGPLFILGTVAIGMFNNSKVGLIIIISHISGALINGLFYKCKKENNIFALNTTNTQNVLNESMTSSVTSIMAVGGFIALFYMILQILLALNIISPLCIILDKIGIEPAITTSIFCGIMEVTTGCLFLSKIGLSLIPLTAIATFLISFGGLSIHAQAFCFLKSFNMKYSTFLRQKITQAVISTIIAWVFGIILF